MKNLFKPIYLGIVLSNVVLLSFNRASLNCRRLRAPLSLEGAIASQQIKAIVLDLDFTLAESGQPIDDDALEDLFILNRQGMHIAVVSGAFYEIINQRLLSQIIRYSEARQLSFDWTRFYVFSNTGAEGFRFSEDGQHHRFFNRPFSLQQYGAIANAAADFSRYYGADSIVRVYDQSQSKFTLYFQETGLEAISEYIGFFNQRLEGLNLEISSGGNRVSIDITTVNKGEPLEVIKAMLGFENEELMIVGDSFKDEYGNDRSMLLAGALVFNVGEVASRAGLINTADYLDPNTAGVEHTLNLLNGLIESNIDFMEVFQDIRYGGPFENYNGTINDGDVRIEIYGKRLDSVSERGELSEKTGFLTIKVFNNNTNEILAYSVVYPTPFGYALAYSQGVDRDIGSLAGSIMAQAKEAFRLEPGISRMQQLTIQPSSVQILGSYLSSYFYEKHLYTSSYLEAFISAVDSLREAIKEFSIGKMPDEATIVDRLKTVYLNSLDKSKEMELLESSRELSNHFNNYYFYYHLFATFY